MLATIIIVISYMATLLAVAQSSAKKPDGPSYLGFTKAGFMLVLLASLGMVFGIAKEVLAIRDANAIRMREVSRDRQLQLVYAKALGAEASSKDPVLAEHIRALAEEVAHIAARGRGSDFRISDFSFSVFDQANLSNSSFRGALFSGADLRGADLSSAVVDEGTRMPDAK